MIIETKKWIHPLRALFARADALVAQVNAAESPSPQVIDLMHGMLRKIHKDLSANLQMEDLESFHEVMTKVLKVDAMTAKLESELTKRVTSRRAIDVPGDIIHRVLGNGNIVAPPPEYNVRQEGETNGSPAQRGRWIMPEVLDQPDPAPEELQNAPARTENQPPALRELAREQNVALAPVGEDLLQPPPELPVRRLAASTGSGSESVSASGRSAFSITSVASARKRSAPSYGTGTASSNAAEYEQAREIEQGVEISRPIGQSDLNELKRRSKSHLRPFDGKYLDWPAFWAEFRGKIHLNPKLAVMDKFSILMDRLRQTPLTTVRSYLASREQGYPKALEALLSMYHRPTDIRARIIEVPATNSSE